MSDKTAKDLKTYCSTIRLLNSFDYKGFGYKDKYAWLRELYGNKSNAQLVDAFQQQFDEQEGIL